VSVEVVVSDLIGYSPADWSISSPVLLSGFDHPEFVIVADLTRACPNQAAWPFSMYWRSVRVHVEGSQQPLNSFSLSDAVLGQIKVEGLFPSITGFSVLAESGMSLAETGQRVGLVIRVAMVQCH
jgi:hypothetical protein